MHYDVIVVGAGSMGMAAGYYLSKNGQKTLLLDAFNPPHNRGSHHGDTRIIRYAYGENEAYVPLALKSQELWNDIEQQTDRELFLQTGVLNVGNSESPFIANVIASANKFSLPLEIMKANQVNQKWPGITLPKNFIACHEPSSGILKSEECILTYAQLAKKHGATILTNCPVMDISIQGKNVRITTKDQVFYSDSLVLSAGAWSTHLLALLDLNLPLTPIRKTFAWFNVNESMYNSQHFPAFAFDTSTGIYYGFPSINGSGLKVGRHDGGEKINPDSSIIQFGEFPEDEGDLKQFLQKYMSMQQDILLKNGKTCIYTLTPDENFIIDLHPSYPNVAIAAGFSGHGFKFSSVVGKILSELIIEGSSEEDISLFSVRRFDN
ncbi:N-methyl-L-tryptophan oxidase [Sutcliffiella halmapala]|uniref:N-methyl-L-tryptophan oxidase n=1 Tax=Sutcliffiella halmapala TaxID=79882 RepID=UPI00099543C2|nr:N-methyl-L-tryptophan oxidase [Sutcliffiella halmapala]